MEIKYYLTSSGRSPVEKFLHELSEELKGEFFDAASLLASGKSLQMPLSRNLSSICHGLHELRFRDNHGHIRFFYYVKKGDAIYFLHALRKKRQTISGNDRALILKRLREI